VIALVLTPRFMGRFSPYHYSMALPMTLDTNPMCSSGVSKTAKHAKTCLILTEQHEANRTVQRRSLGGGICEGVSEGLDGWCSIGPKMLVSIECHLYNKKGPITPKEALTNLTIRLETNPLQ